MHGLAVLFVLSLGPPPCSFEETVGAPQPSEPPPAAPAVAATPPVAAKPPAPIPPPLAQRERTHYRIEYGPLHVGEIHVAISGAAPGAQAVRAGGQGAGAVLGMGRMSNSIATDFDLQRLDSRRWVNARENDDRALRDHAEQLTPGHLNGGRMRTRPRVEEQPLQATLALGAPLLDPLAFLLRLRAAPPAPGVPQTLYVLDGQALWRLTVQNVGRSALPEGTVSVPTFRLDAQADPVRWDGVVDEAGERKRRSFSVWLSDDSNKVPLRLEMPLGPSAIVVALTEITRRPL